MSADACRLTVIENDDAVAVLYCGGPLRDNYRRGGILKPCYIASDEQVGRVVESREAVVEDKYFGFCRKRTGDGYALSLTTRKVASVLFDYGVKSVL